MAKYEPQESFDMTYEQWVMQSINRLNQCATQPGLSYSEVGYESGLNDVWAGIPSKEKKEKAYGHKVSWAQRWRDIEKQHNPYQRGLTQDQRTEATMSRCLEKRQLVTDIFVEQLHLMVQAPSGTEMYLAALGETGDG